ncbi:MAG: SusE domain-containing protein [Bacteroidales bacterium]|nr:SusE domain-containing protein [Bacteroidales bacterium]MDZ4204317.1 SusE domain-containing protein [Bacteroidales bacterium]
MKSKIIYLAGIIGLLGFLASCEKDETKVVMSETPTPPSLVTLPNLTLQRANANNTIIFIGTAVNPGFIASATYFLEASSSATNFADALLLYSGVRADTMKFKVSDLNGLMLRKFPADQVSSVHFRLRSLLVVDAGTGALGTSTKPLQYISAVKTVSVTIYGLPRLDLINSGITQKIESAAGDGVYFGYVKLDATKPFTLRDPDANKTYGATGSNLVVNGNPIIPPGTGWHAMTANTIALTYTISPYMIGLVGSATPNGWNTPDQKMDYDVQAGTWKITLDLVQGEIKFRKNDGWAWNLGGTPDNLTQGGANIAVTAGNYTITLTIINDLTGKCTIVKN